MKFIGIGAGAGGLAAAILLAKDGHEVDIYDALPEIKYTPEESYAVGLNPRGLSVIKQIDEQLYDTMTEIGKVDSWDIFMYKRRLASQKSGTTIGSSRGHVVQVLYEQSLKYSNIKMHFGHKLVDIDFASKKLKFSILNSAENKTENDEVFEVDASDARILAADGVWSKTRRLIGEHDNTFEAEVLPWNTSFRVLLSSDSPVTELNRKVHYIFVNAGIYTSSLTPTTWTVVMQIRDNDEQRFMDSKEATPENVEKLKAFLKKHGEMVEHLIPEEEYTNFFSRRTFTGAVTKVSRLNHGEWIVLLGDAAHAVLPPTGEGINSALEDAKVLHEMLSKEDVSNAFSAYNEERLPDVYALNEYARHLLKGWIAPKKERVAASIVNIGLNVAQSVGIFEDSWAEKSFGHKAETVEPYRKMTELWKSQISYFYPFANFVSNWFVSSE